MLGKLSVEEINNLLTSQVVGRLGCSDGLQPYIVPVTYCYDGKYIYGQTSEGAKLSILRKNPKVCFEVDLMLNMRHWHCVIITGIFEELTDEESDKAREILFGKVYSLQTSTTIHYAVDSAVTVQEESNRIKKIMYRIKVLELSGRYERE